MNLFILLQKSQKVMVTYIEIIQVKRLEKLKLKSVIFCFFGWFTNGASETQSSTSFPFFAGDASENVDSLLALTLEKLGLSIFTMNELLNCRVKQFILYSHLQFILLAN